MTLARMAMLRTFSPLLLLLASGAPAWAQDASAQTDGRPEVVVEGHALSRDIPCNGASVGIYGVRNTVNLTDTCASIVIHGQGHVVTFQKAGDVAITGPDHKVTGGEATGLAVTSTRNQVETGIRPAGKDALVDVTGANQSLVLKLAGPVRMEVSGVDNEVRWSLTDSAPEPRISVMGVQNQITHEK